MEPAAGTTPTREVFEAAQNAGKGCPRTRRLSEQFLRYDVMVIEELAYLPFS